MPGASKLSAPGTTLPFANNNEHLCRPFAYPVCYAVALQCQACKAEFELDMAEDITVKDDLSYCRSLLCLSPKHASMNTIWRFLANDALS